MNHLFPEAMEQPNRRLLTRFLVLNVPSAARKPSYVGPAHADRPAGGRASTATRTGGGSHRSDGKSRDSAHVHSPRIGGGVARHGLRAGILNLRDVGATVVRELFRDDGGGGIRS
jgi:hypothetical protein